MSAEALHLWRQKLDRYREAEALATDPSEKFRLEHQIAEALKKIAELEALLASALVALAPPAATTPAVLAPPEPASPVSPSPRRFRIALSFPGDHRTLIAPIARALADVYGEAQILYDHFHTAEFARPNLAVYLPELYRRQSDLIVVLLCPEYAKKQWCRLEFRHIHALIATTEEDRIMFLSVGNPGDLGALGILPGDGYIDITGRTPDEVCRLIQQRARLAAEEGGA